jgi:hypothetical protein
MRGHSALFKRSHRSIIGKMSATVTALALLTAQSAAQLGAPVPAIWDPAAAYITVGQDEPGYRSWYLSLPTRVLQVKAFNAYLATWEVAGIVPTWQLFRTATSWQKCAGQPFEIPPTSDWPHIVQTLRYVRDYVIPAVGPVEPVSGYRNPVLNLCAGGAHESAHKHYSAIDLVPLRPTSRESLMRTLCAVHGRRGPDYEVGLGFYAFLRFHVDTTKYRRWNMDPAVANQCPPIVRTQTIAVAGQPAAQPEPSDPLAPIAAPAVAPAPATPHGAPERGQPLQH